VTPHRRGLGGLRVLGRPAGRPAPAGRTGRPAIVILARPGAPAVPYARLLAGLGRDLVLVSGPSSRAADGGYARHLTVRRYASAETESAVLRYAEQAPVCGLVALDFEDLVRAGALRDHLGLPGMGREDALVLTDPALAAGHLERAGVPCVRRAPVHAPGDLYWLAHRWGYPLRVRSARMPGRPVLGVLHGEADVRRFTRDGAGADGAGVADAAGHAIGAGGGCPYGLRAQLQRKQECDKRDAPEQALHNVRPKGARLVCTRRPHTVRGRATDTNYKRGANISGGRFHHG
jgi:hypothetical protein